MNVTLGLAVIAGALMLALVLETLAHRRNLRQLRIRVHVNGTRGKSSVTRLIAAGLREHGLITCAKTTGTLPRMILPDARELPIFRVAAPNIIEQRRIVAAAAAQRAEALVIECMALQPALQALCELKLIRATHGVITNARPDHLDVMGPTEQHVAEALAGTVPVAGHVYTAEQQHLGILRQAAVDRNSTLIAIGPEAIASVSPEELARFSYTEHADNVALALRVCMDLGVRRDVALRGMWNCAPDPGALTTYHVDFFGRRLVFMNAFAANDPVSTEQLWKLAVTANPQAETRIAVFNCRSDRPERSVSLGAAFARWAAADYVVLMGSGTHTFARAANRSGVDFSRFVFVEGLPVAEIFERILSLIQKEAMIVGMGNIGGDGLPLVRYFANRASLTTTH
ncbi:MAG TPA: poly-gamma-glutamate synthase PgsB [Polyangiaceae bacterium]|nr:poly-gamma-glutamate synthase PgsB [Polyangiaceae bacterium]